ncbi:MAG: CcmD family protein [Bacteroidetes bacterium]|jgi:CcmD family protein|nr:CcmD family protein [Bacteroidota bacterium]
MLEFLAEHQMYIVLGIVLITWAGIVWYLFRLDGRMKRLEEGGH